MRWLLLLSSMICMTCLAQTQAQSQNPKTVPSTPQTVPNIVVSNSPQTQQSINQLFDQNATYHYFKKHHPEKLFDIPKRGDDAS